jgi:hypothetical protein
MGQTVFEKKIPKHFFKKRKRKAKKRGNLLFYCLRAFGKIWKIKNIDNTD